MQPTDDDLNQADANAGTIHDYQPGSVPSLKAEAKKLNANDDDIAVEREDILEGDESGIADESTTGVQSTHTP